jgi:hypothetical protein
MLQGNTVSDTRTRLCTHRQSGSPYSLTKQAYAVGNETKTLYSFARGTQYPLFLGWPLWLCSHAHGAPAPAHTSTDMCCALLPRFIPLPIL